MTSINPVLRGPAGSDAVLDRVLIEVNNIQLWGTKIVGRDTEVLVDDGFDVIMEE